MNIPAQVKAIADVYDKELPTMPDGTALHHYTHVSWQASRDAGLALPGLFVETGYPGGVDRAEGWRQVPPDISVAFTMTCHRDNVVEACTIRDEMLGKAFDIAVAHGKKPWVTYIYTQPSNDARSWGAGFAICLGPCES